MLAPLLTRPPILIDLAEGPGPDLAIAFSSIGHDPTRPPSPEFVGTATGRGGTPRRALFVRDAARSWGNHPDLAPALAQALATVTAHAPVRRIAAIGLSMGGYAALVAARLLPVDVVLAFGPQHALTPPDPRWSRWMTALPPLIWPLAPLPPPGRAVLFHGGQDDLATAQRFPEGKGTDHLIFPAESHGSLVPHLKARGCLSGLLDAALDADRRRRRAEAAVIRAPIGCTVWERMAVTRSQVERGDALVPMSRSACPTFRRLRGAGAALHLLARHRDCGALRLHPRCPRQLELPWLRDPGHARVLQFLPDPVAHEGPQAQSGNPSEMVGTARVRTDTPAAGGGPDRHLQRGTADP